MNKGFIKSPSEMVCRIKSICLILSTILLLMLFTSCGSVRSLKNGNSTSKSQYENAGENESDLTSNDENSNNHSTKRLPTLKEQIKNIQSEQETINAKVTVLQSDVDDIKNTLNEIKGALNNLPNDGKKEIVSGLKVKKDNIILPDSDVQVVPPVKENKKPKANSSKWKPLPKNGVIFSDENSNEVTEPTPAKPIAKNIQKRVPIQRNIQKEKPKTIVTQPVIKEKEPDIQINNIKENSTIIIVQQDLEKKNYQEALQKLNSIIEKESHPEIIHKCNYLLGESNFGLKQYDKAIFYYNKVLKSKYSENKDNAQIMIAESHIRSGQVEEAKKAYQAFVQKYPTSELMPKARKMLQQL